MLDDMTFEVMREFSGAEVSLPSDRDSFVPEPSVRYKGKTFRRKWGSTHKRTEEMIIIDGVQRRLAKKVRRAAASTLDTITPSTSEWGLLEAVGKFSVLMRQTIPFFSYSSIENYMVDWRTHAYVKNDYIRMFDAPKRLSDLVSKRLLSCGGQCIVIKESLPENSWGLYHPYKSTMDFAREGTEQITRTHTVLAKMHGSHAIVIDPSEGPEHYRDQGWYYVMHRGNFVSRYAKADVR